MGTGVVVFDNPNCPSQPAPGVYCWYYHEEGSRKPFYFYLGEAGRRESRVAKPSTLARGALEAKGGSSVSSQKGRSLDTDFIVGAAIQWLRGKGYDCHWRHLGDDPMKEKDFCSQHEPVLQGNGVNILPLFKMKRDEGCWTSAKAAEARRLLRKQFASEFCI